MSGTEECKVFPGTEARHLLFVRQQWTSVLLDLPVPRASEWKPEMRRSLGPCPDDSWLCAFVEKPCGLPVK